jgi:hypothetical protein
VKVIGVNGFHRGGALVGVLAACLVLTAAAAAQSPDPDAAPSPSPDPAPTPAQTKPAAKPAVKAPAPTQATTPQTTPTPANESSPDSGAPRRTTHHPKRRKQAATKHTAASRIPPLPHIKPAQLLASPSDGDDRARRLAIGAIALLLLALASATLVAFTARFERRRMMR